MEKWVQINDYPGYMVSNIGRVKSCHRKVFSKRYPNGKNIPEKVLKPHLVKGCRHVVTLSKRNKTKRFYVHRLVAIHFISNDMSFPFVNHIDGNPLNNSLANLEWCTHQENMDHAIKSGLIKSKLNILQVRVIRKLIPQMPSLDIAKIFNVSKSTIQSIREGKLYGRFFNYKPVDSYKKLNSFSSKKLNPITVRKIRIDLERFPAKKVAKKYKISEAMVHRIKSKRSWAKL